MILSELNWRKIAEYLYLCTMNSVRQNKIARLIQKDMGDIFQLEGRSLFGGALITVTRVNVTKDLSLARVFVSLFATADKESLLESIRQSGRELRYKLGLRVKNQLRVVPELQFYLDDSLDYIENLENLLKT